VKLKFIIDAQLPPALAQWLCEQGHSAKHVQDVGLREADDSPIWHYALAQDAIVLTKDEDFAGRVRQSRKTPVIVWLRVGNCSNRALREWLFPLLPDVLREIESGQRFIEVR
jgi:predicted nuclease of predicted toxin-antitoxin system